MKFEDQRSRQSGFTFIKVAPKGPTSENPTMRRLRALHEVEKSLYKGASAEFVGRPGGCLVPKTSHLEGVHRKFLQSIYGEGDYRPPLITFSAVSEAQLVKGGPPQNTYSKGNFLHQKELLYRVFKTDARLVRSIFEHAGFSHTDSHDWNLMWIGTSAQPYLYEGLNEYQKINHFPSSSEVTRKDKLCMNILRMQERYGQEAFDFIPETYVLPEQFPDFYASFHEQKRSRWIVKPSCSSQGRGIFLVDSINEVPMDENCIISKYIQNPLLINGLKFDLRLYVLITGFEPLKLYIYDEGLARFASETYSPDARKNRFAHLTNYSVNKKNDKFVQNQDHLQDDVGHKWSLSALFRYLESAGVDVDYLWSRIYDLIIKTILSIEPIVIEASHKISLHRNNCFDLFGFDVLIDSNLKPWLLEVNLSPSLATDSPLDLHIKGNLIADALNLIGIRLFDRKTESMNKVKQRLRVRQVQLNQGVKTRECTATKIKEAMRDLLEENERRGRFFRIYPSEGVEHYNQYFVTIRHLNRAIYKALYKDARELPQPKLPVTSSTRPETTEKKFVPEEPKKPCEVCQGNLPCNCKDKDKREEKLVITGDDILMEYISRLTKALKNSSHVKVQWKKKIERFVTHYVWNSNDNLEASLAQRLHARLIEMRERQKRLLANQKQKQHITLDEQKAEVVQGFSAQQLENMLSSTTRNIAQEVVSCLIGPDERGILTEIEKICQNSSFN